MLTIHGISKALVTRLRLLTDRFADGKPQNNELFEEGFDVRVPRPELQRKGAFVQITHARILTQIGMDLWVNETYEAQLLVCGFSFFFLGCLICEELPTSDVQVART